MAPDYIFFTSYARLDDDKDLLSEAVDELQKRVSAKVGYPIEIFFDIKELPNGVKWTDDPRERASRDGRHRLPLLAFLYEKRVLREGVRGIPDAHQRRVGRV
jgi:hypothetical protein